MLPFISLIISPLLRMLKPFFKAFPMLNILFSLRYFTYFTSSSVTMIISLFFYGISQHSFRFSSAIITLPFPTVISSKIAVSFYNPHCLFQYWQEALPSSIQISRLKYFFSKEVRKHPPPHLSWHFLFPMYL
jgi:hypothetical protein